MELLAVDLTFVRYHHSDACHYYNSVIADMNEQDDYVNDEVQSKHGMLTLDYLIDYDAVTNQDDDSAVDS